MLLELGNYDPKNECWPIFEVSENTKEIGTLSGGEADISEIIARNNKLEPSNIKKLCDEFVETTLGFMDKHNLGAGEAIALIETLKFGIMNKV